jgi:multidrug efflux system membrane fusion protein
MPLKRKLVAARAFSLAVVTAVTALYSGNGGGTLSEAVAAVAPPLADVDVAAVIFRSVTDYQSYSGRIEAV